MIYHEVSHSRPVCYGGLSSGGGHEFVCDGYKFEQNTDFFHINWGWGGMSDGFFVLTVMKPDAQGIGGSTASDGYSMGHNIYIGLEPPGRTQPGETGDDSGEPQFESIFWATMLFNSGLAVMPSKNMINNVGASADSTHYSAYKTMPRRLKQLFSMPRYDIDFPLQHPRYVIEEVGYWKRMYKANGWGYPLTKVSRSLEELWLNLRYGNWAFIFKSIGRRLRIWTGKEKFG
jgi:hypothetical protein